jgi:hypothetical protein
LNVVNYLNVANVLKIIQLSEFKKRELNDTFESNITLTKFLPVIALAKAGNTLTTFIKLTTFTMSPIQSPPDPFTQLIYRIFYGIKGLYYAIFKKKQS